MTIEKKPGRKLVANNPDNDQAETDAIAAVQAYERVVKRLVSFVAEHPEVFGAYQKLLESLESKRKIADAKMRATDASFGDWKRTEQRSYDAALLCEKIGLVPFCELGGVVTTETVHTIEKDKVELAIEEKKIPAAVVAEVRTITAKYQAPKTMKGPDP
jgi:hypothetical protein